MKLAILCSPFVVLRGREYRELLFSHPTAVTQQPRPNPLPPTHRLHHVLEGAGIVDDLKRLGWIRVRTGATDAGRLEQLLGLLHHGIWEEGTNTRT